tara:strand:+ start:173 stop:487 length:315 start_codon:yes stop_codon:yes gene_type:complete
MVSAAAVCVAGFSASAQVVTVDYELSDGETQTWNYDEATMTMIGPDGFTTPYTMDVEASKVCGLVQDTELCVTFDEIGREVGHSTHFELSDGRSGTATVVSVEP